jgi:hypothetical protein
MHPAQLNIGIGAIGIDVEGPLEGIPSVVEAV